jgi:hypothetical protein
MYKLGTRQEQAIFGEFNDRRKKNRGMEKIDEKHMAKPGEIKDSLRAGSFLLSCRECGICSLVKC